MIIKKTGTELGFFRPKIALNELIWYFFCPVKMLIGWESYEKSPEIFIILLFNSGPNFATISSIFVFFWFANG